MQSAALARSAAAVPVAHAHVRAARVRVMHVVLSLDPGGTERLVLDLVGRLEAEAESVVCCLDSRGRWGAALAQDGVPVYALGRRPGFDGPLGWRIAALAARHDVSVLHCHHYSPFVYGRLAAMLRSGLRVVFTEHGRLSDAGPSRKRRWINPFLSRLPARIFAVSEDLRNHMVAEGIAPRRVRVLYNGIDPGRPTTRALRRAARALLGLPEHATVVGTVARLDAVKDLGTLIQGFAALPAAGQDDLLVIAGDGPELESLREQCRAAGVGGRVRFVGHQSDVRAILPAFDAYANSSVHEGVSLTILEAMAASLPVVATRVGGTPEVIVDGETGVLVPPRAPRAIARALASVLARPDRGQRLGEAGRFRVEAHFHIDQMLAAYLREYEAGG
ncbi:MAG: glycosyltransferase [Acidobacteria bacterium]|nr:glycosyltransferase [Acidobacteriota bacterium]